MHRQKSESPQTVNSNLKRLVALVYGYPSIYDDDKIVTHIFSIITDDARLPTLKQLATEGLGYSLSEINTAGSNSCNFESFLRDKGVPEIVLRLINNRRRADFLISSGMAKKMIQDHLDHLNQSGNSQIRVTARNVTQVQLGENKLIKYFFNAHYRDTSAFLLTIGLINRWSERDNWPTNWIEFSGADSLFRELRQKYCDKETGVWQTTEEIRTSNIGKKFLGHFNNSVSDMLDFAQKAWGIQNVGTPAINPQGFWMEYNNCRTRLKEIIEEEFPNSKKSLSQLLLLLNQNMLYNWGASGLTRYGIENTIMRIFPEFEYKRKNFQKNNKYNSYLLHERLCQLGLTSENMSNDEIEVRIPRSVDNKPSLKVDVVITLKVNGGDTPSRIFFEIQGEQHVNPNHRFVIGKFKSQVERDAEKLDYTTKNGIPIYLRPDDLYGERSIDKIKQRCLEQGLDLNKLEYFAVPSKILHAYWVNEKLLHKDVLNSQDI